MQRYFLEVAYKGTNYSGFQVQQNANTIQAEIEKAFFTVFRTPVNLTGSSRTDAGVHALQNFFHFDQEQELNLKFIYKLNAVLPPDIVITNIFPMGVENHSRFHAIGREYEYNIYTRKNPFLKEIAFYYPYKLDLDILREAAIIIKKQTNFFAFAKTHTQVSNFNCTIYLSEWRLENDLLKYCIKANRFLRGMVRQLTATQLKLARGKISITEFQQLFNNQQTKCTFSVPPTGLFLKAVEYPENFFPYQA